MTIPPTLPSDRQLITAARSGHDAAWTELLSRHEPAVRSVLPARTPAAKRALTNLFEELRHELGEASAQGHEEIRAFRPLVISRSLGGRFGPSPAGTTVSGSEDGDDEILARAFSRLPEPWQTVLWHCHVEQLTASEVAPFVGRTTHEVAELVSTAERGLTDAFLVEYAETHRLSNDEAILVLLLGGHVRDALPAHESRLVTEHLAQPSPPPLASPTPSPAVRPLDSIVSAPVEDTAFNDTAFNDTGLDDATQTAGSDHSSGSAPGVLLDSLVGYGEADEQSTAATTTVERAHSSDDSRRLLSVIGSLSTVLPPAIAPGITGLTVQQHRRALANSPRAFGAEGRTATVATQEGRRPGSLLGYIALGAAAAAVLALLAVGVLSSAGRSGDLTGQVAGVEAATPGDPDPAVGDVGEPADSDEPVDPDPDPDGVTTTTLVDLRPSGTANDIGVVMNAGLRADSVGALDTSLTTSVDTSAPIFAGGTGTLELSIENAGDEPVDANVELQLPRGVVLDGLASGDATCDDPADASPYCDVTVPAGSQLDISVRLGLESVVVGRLAVDGDSLDEPFEAAIVATRDLVHNSVGRGDVLVAGNTVMTCDVAAAEADDIDCAAVVGGIGTVVNRWDVPMAFTGVAPGFGFANSSTAVVDIGDAASVVSAHLFWAGDLEESGVSAARDGQMSATIVTPAGEVENVEASRVKFGEEDSTQYLSRVDVTDLVARGGGGEYVVGNIASVETQGSFGAWALVVVTDDDDLPFRHRIVTDPFDWVAPQEQFTYSVELPVPVVEGASAQLDVFGLEGERGFEPETLTVAGQPVGGENPFNSTIVGERSPTFENNLGVDIDVYDLTIDSPTGTLLIESRSDDDGIRLAVLGLTVDLDT